ncbi:hypothetical protein DC31_13955 [Microbacterium sp. CH12i]|uniref:fibronectin type III domain-containing protein n=1 Tax=Microbacterium sp. CH12i TaxID=1479651 RepID=UPI000460DAA1|nr:fibronectin type III domain-containing protein [Microbacterium sp. CH12i]KDA05866.1 hypothetical protein DC31_13955 [Microbacterium sp. CH12i]
MALIASRSIGNAGTMEIHDDGVNVTMRIRSSDGSTYSGAIPIQVLVNNSWSGWFNVGYPSGSPWVNVWAGGLYFSQSVAFRVGATGTWGFGNGGELWAAVGRATVPDAPTMTGFGPNPDQITATSMRVRFNGHGDGGSPITSWALQRATDAAFTQNVVTIGSSGTSVVTGLAPGTQYWWRARGGNAVGVGAWSPDPVSARTLSAAYVGKGSTFPPAAAVNVGKGSTFPQAEIFVGKGGSFVTPA